MSGTIELRTAVRADGTQQHMYRIGTEEWIDITTLKRSVLHEDADGMWTVHSFDQIGGGAA